MQDEVDLEILTPVVLSPICMARISSIILKVSSCPKGSYLDSCSFNSFLEIGLMLEWHLVLEALKQKQVTSMTEHCTSYHYKRHNSCFQSQSIDHYSLGKVNNCE